MSRPVRIHIPRATYLVHLRARDGVSLFRGEKDREIFLQSLGDASGPAGVSVYAYALMETSALLFLRAGDLPLSHFVHRTQAGYFNRLRAQNGESIPLIRDRHRAILVEEGEFFSQVVRRVHMAPIIGGHWSNESEARRWGEVSTNLWTSFPLYTGGKPEPDWFCCDEVLNKFGAEDRKKSENEFYQYIIQGVKKNDSDDLLDSVVAMSLLGSAEFVSRYYECAKGRRRSLPVTDVELVSHVDPDKRFSRILTVVAEHYNTSSSELTKARSRHPGRKFVVELALRHAMDEGGVKKLGERLQVSGSALAHLRRAFQESLEKDAESKDLFALLEKRVLAV